jgi:hypothetical protein
MRKLIALVALVVLGMNVGDVNKGYLQPDNVQRCNSTGLSRDSSFIQSSTSSHLFPCDNHLVR